MHTIKHYIYSSAEVGSPYPIPNPQLESHILVQRGNEGLYSTVFFLEDRAPGRTSAFVVRMPRVLLAPTLTLRFYHNKMPRTPSTILILTAKS